jgi:hypothetical protein
MYWCLGYGGEFKDADLVAATPTVTQLLLEIARLEELRLNVKGLVGTYGTLGVCSDDYDKHPPLGFLRGATLNRNAALEHGFLGCTNNDTTDRSVHQAKKLSVLAAINAAHEVHLLQQGLGVPDTLVLVALHTHRTTRDESVQHTFASCGEVIAAVHVLVGALRGPDGDINKSFLKRICKLMTMSVVECALAKLVTSQYITSHWTLTDVSYSLLKLPSYFCDHFDDDLSPPTPEISSLYHNTAGRRVAALLSAAIYCAAA